MGILDAGFVDGKKVGHAVSIIGVSESKDKLTVIDPDDGKIKSLPISDFISAYYFTK